MENAIIATPDNAIQTQDFAATATKYLHSLGGTLAPKHTEQFIHLCTHYQLDPFKREIYGIPYGDKFNIIVGYESYIKRAELTGKLNGWRAYTEGTFELEKTTIERRGKRLTVEIPTGKLKGCIEIFRKDWDKPFVHEVALDEYAQPNEMWCKKTLTMIKKVATAQAFRLCFPVEFGGMPYTGDEMGEEVNPVEFTAVEEIPVDARDPAKFDEYLADMESIKSLPHLTNWLKKHADDIKNDLTQKEIETLRTRSSIRIKILKQVFKDSQNEGAETFECGLNGETYTHDDCKDLTCREHCEHFNQK